MDTANQEWRDGLKVNLKKGEAVVEFTKLNGQHRVLRCTLKQDVVPPFPENRVVKVKPNPDTLCVWDLDKSEWRSFRYDRVTSVRFEA